MPVTRRELHVEDTRRALLAAARHEFAANGYAEASLDDIVARAKVTKGALYHHFKNKAALLEAVYIAMEEELAVRVKRAVDAAGGGARKRMAAALGAFFETSAEPAYARIVLRDAPPVLQPGRHRDIDQAIGLGLVIELVSGLRAEGLIGDLPVATTARVLLAMVGEVATAMAHASDPEAVYREGVQVIEALVDGLAAAAGAPRRSRGSATRAAGG